MQAYSNGLKISCGRDHFGNLQNIGIQKKGLPLEGMSLPNDCHCE